VELLALAGKEDDMKLSDAIRLGAMLKPQGFNGMLRHGRSCAFGAAMDALGLLEKWGPLGYLPNDVVARWPVLNVRTVNPVTHAVVDVCEAVVDLNDIHLWTRERIADFVEQVEREAETRTPEAAAVTVTA
jgi:hypothetical protein